MLATRILTALMLVPATLAALFLLPPLGWALVTLAIIVLASTEWTRLTGFARGRWLFPVGTLVLGAGLLAFGDFDRNWPAGLVVAVCAAATVFWVAIAPLWLRWRWKAQPAVVAAVVGWLVLLAAWVALVQLQARSPWAVLAAMAVVWIADTAAYFSGRAFGRRKLAPAISPGKTWEGVVGGLVAVAVYAVLVLAAQRAHLAPGAAWPVAWFVLALAVGALSVVGDLFESLLKREVGVKDSGHLLPGHGGILDRIDALIAAVPPLALMAEYGLR